MLQGGETFAADPAKDRLTNWPARPANEDPEIRPGALLLAGTDSSGQPWFEIAGNFGPTQDGCWEISGGVFDAGPNLWFSSGLAIPKASTFQIRPVGLSDPFPGREDDIVCVSEQGQAVYFEGFQPK
jgi:hypothetical protein